MIRGSEGMAVQFAQCCKPIPGDPIIGLISKGQGMVIHTHDCSVIVKTRADPGKVIDVEWAPDGTSVAFVSTSRNHQQENPCLPVVERACRSEDEENKEESPQHSLNNRLPVERIHIQHEPVAIKILPQAFTRSRSVDTLWRRRNGVNSGHSMPPN